MISVRFFPISWHPYSSQLLAGLFDLEAAGEINLSIERPSCLPIQERDWGDKHNGHLAYVEVSDDSKFWKKMVCDFLDGPEIISPDALSECDVYFKRSFSSDYIAGRRDQWQIDTPIHRQKIHPYGLNYPNYSPSEHSRLMRALVQARVAGLWSKEPRKALELINNATFKRLTYLPKKLIGRGSVPRTVSCPASTAVKPQILFQTRIFAENHPKYKEDTNAFNQQRVDLVRHLKQRFAKRFVGGLTPTPYTIKNFPDVVTQERVSNLAYIKLVEESAIAIHTEGKRHSIGWRLPEYVAMSKAIVAQPLAYEIPVPLEIGRNIEVFASAEECGDHCERLLNNPDQIQAMREANDDYYQTVLKPEKLVMSLLTRALSAPRRNHLLLASAQPSPKAGHSDAGENTKSVG